METIDIFAAVFKSTAIVREIARFDFIARFSEDAFNNMIAPYIENCFGYIWCAPPFPQVYWYLDHVARLSAQEKNKIYEPPPQFIAVPDTMPELIRCATCNKLVVKTFTYQREHGQSCIMCEYPYNP